MKRIGLMGFVTQQPSILGLGLGPTEGTRRDQHEPVTCTRAVVTVTYIQRYVDQRRRSRQSEFPRYTETKEGLWRACYFVPKLPKFGRLESLRRVCAGKTGMVRTRRTFRNKNAPHI
jgi:hypothetical protein